MKPEQLVVDRNLIKSIMKGIPKMFFSTFSPDEIRSEIYFAIYKANNKFDPKKGRLINFVSRIVVNALNKKLVEHIQIRQNECPLEAAYSKTYTQSYESDCDLTLLAYFRTLPEEWITELTEFVLGKKKKEEIAISNDPSFERVLSKIDCLII